MSASTQMRGKGGLMHRFLARLRATFRSGAVAGAVLALVAALPGPVAAALPLTELAASHNFTQPLYLTNAGDGRLFVVEKGGVIKIIHPNESVTTFLNISGQVSTSSERGLLGLAFHPNYASNGLFYVDYTRGDGDIVVAEFQVSANANVADDTSERILLTIEHSSAGNHNGGWLDFKDGNLFISVGDGATNPNNAQDLGSLLGKILRINPADPDGVGPLDYTIPSTNPYVGRTGLDEIWARGFRNPWRCSHDMATGNLWCADVGQSKYEEVNRKGTGKGLNFGWPLLEGMHKYPSGTLCSSSCKTLPILEYKHNVSGSDDNCSVTGGYVSRRAGAALFGQYVYGDLCSGRVWSVPYNMPRGGNVGPALANTGHSIYSFGQDAAGRLYLVAGGGGIFRLNDS
jgi:glucose/arabinose dehydrogenase